MKTLLLLRHAKSSRDDPDLADHDRPLNSRGKDSARQVGKFLREEGLVPDWILASTALRARKTAEKVAKRSRYDRAIELEKRLYLAEPPAYFSVIRGAKADCERLLVVGHNPGISEFLNQLAGVSEEMATAGLAVVELPIDRWKDLTAKKRSTRVRLWRPPRT